MNQVAVSQQPTFGARIKAALGSRYTREPFILLSAYFLYYMARHLADDAKPAFENARYLMKVEQSIGIFREISFQSAILSYETVIHAFNIIYFYGHWPAIVAIGAYLFVTKPQVYTITRNAFLISGAIALVFFVLFPVAPPRLATFGIVDTLSWTIPIDYDNSPMVNPYAALPSMHVGWALLISLGLLLSTQKRWLRLIAFMLTPAMWLATIITGNHFFIDGIFGTILSGTAFLVAFWLHGNWEALVATVRENVRDLWRRPKAT
jgi:membrane-associated phospholipid phosphatase